MYYSGHGAADPETKINYLIPVDVTSAEDENLWISSLNLNNVVENLREQAPTATHYVVFDACRNELNLTRKGQKALSNKGYEATASVHLGWVLAVRDRKARGLKIMSEPDETYRYPARPGSGRLARRRTWRRPIGLAGGPIRHSCRASDPPCSPWENRLW